MQSVSIMAPFKTRSPLLSVVKRVAAVLSACQRKPDAAHFLAKNGCPENGAPDGFSAEAGLRALLHSLKTEAGLSGFGWLSARWDIRQRLATLRRFHEEEAQCPEILEEQIDAPIVITGLPRSGTTFLQTLLSEDPAHQALRCWQSLYPYPRHNRGRDKRVPRVDKQLRYFNAFAPDLHKVYPLHGQSPQECTEITAHVFQSFRFDSIYRVPSYQEWLDRHGHLEAYRFHKRFLQHLQHQTSRRRWVLKAPDHVFAMDALRLVYPDAHIVFMHRDPHKVLPSNAQLIEILRAPFAKSLDPVQIGRQTSADLALAAANMMQVGRSRRASNGQIFHLNFVDLVSRPLDAVKRLYRHFGLPLNSPTIERIAYAIVSNPNGGYAKNIYCPSHHGLDTETIERQFRTYIDYFDVPREPILALQAVRPRADAKLHTPTALRSAGKLAVQPVHLHTPRAKRSPLSFWGDKQRAALPAANRFPCCGPAENQSENQSPHKMNDIDRSFQPSVPYWTVYGSFCTNAQL